MVGENVECDNYCGVKAIAGGRSKYWESRAGLRISSRLTLGIHCPSAALGHTSSQFHPNGIFHALKGASLLHLSWAPEDFLELGEALGVLQDASLPVNP